MAPSKVIETVLPAEFAGVAKVLRYHPVPWNGSPPQRALYFTSNGPSIAQSCGRSSARQGESSKSGFSAPSAAPLWNFQPLSKDSRVVELAEAAFDPQNSPTNKRRRTEIRFVVVNVFGCIFCGCHVRGCQRTVSNCQTQLSSLAPSSKIGLISGVFTTACVVKTRRRIQQTSKYLDFFAFSTC